MDSFREYFITLFSVCCVCTLCDLLSDFASKGVSSALKLLCSLGILMSVFSIFLNGCDIKKELSKLESIYSQAQKYESLQESENVFVENTGIQLEYNISCTIYEKFGIKPVSVSIEFNKENKDGVTEISLQKIDITLPEDTDEISVYSVKSFVGELFGSDAKIICNRST